MTNMFDGKEVSEAIRRVAATLGEEPARQWWLTPNPDLGGAKPGDLMQLGIIGTLDTTRELALRNILNGSAFTRSDR